MKRGYFRPSPQQQVKTRQHVENLDLPVSQRAFESAMQMVARQLGVRFAGDVIPLPEAVQDDPTYPRGLRVLYRKFPFPCDSDEDGGPCVSFDVIPLGVNGDPRRYRTYRSFMGPVEESEELFVQLLRFLRNVVATVDRYRVSRTAGGKRQGPRRSRPALHRASLPL